LRAPYSEGEERRPAMPAADPPLQGEELLDAVT
jgi:hypothetical protein